MQVQKKQLGAMAILACITLILAGSAYAGPRDPFDVCPVVAAVGLVDLAEENRDVAMLECLVTTTSTPVSGDGVTPEEWVINPNCGDIGFDWGWKIDDSPTSAEDFTTLSLGMELPGVPTEFTGGFPGLPGETCSVTVDAGNKTFDWDCSITVEAVIVKGGPRANVYVYAPEDDGDTGLGTVGEGPEISHIEFCINEGMMPVCGNGVVETGEECDDGNTVPGDGCNENCEDEICGNGVVDSGEECDDGNTVPGDGCNENCEDEICGNGVVDSGEECDDGNTVPGDGCNENCEDEICGNGVVDSGEECDDGNTVPGDGCNENCEDEICGNGVVDSGEECDDGNTVPGDGCNENCEDEICGNGVVDSGEECDDGNTVPGDGCNENCEDEICGNGVVDMGEDCDDAGESATCDADCTFVECGDGTTNMTAGEECDDAGESPMCDADCTSAECGDGTVNVTAGEECDDGNTMDDDMCRNDCTVPVCGDAIVDPQNSETCDPPGDPAGGNGNDCRADCTVCGDGVVDPSEQCDDGNGADGDGCENDCSITIDDDPFGACCTNGPGSSSECIEVTESDCLAGSGYFVGGDTDCFDVEDCEALLVTLESMSAKSTPGGVTIFWETSIEIDTIGFRVLRETSTDRREKTLGVVIGLLPAQGHGLSGASYEVLDGSDLAQDAIHYYLEDIDTFGKVTRHGPIVVERTRQGAAPSSRTR